MYVVVSVKMDEVAANLDIRRMLTSKVPV